MHFPDKWLGSRMFLCALGCWLLLLMLIACSPVPKPSTIDGAASRRVAAETGSSTLRIILSPVSSLHSKMADKDRQLGFLGAVSKRVGEFLGMPTRITEAHSATTTVPEGYDLLASFLEPAVFGAGKDTSLPFFPLPGTPLLGPTPSFWHASPSKPGLAAAVAEALFEMRKSGTMGEEFDRAFGAGSASEYYRTIGYDGALHAQYLDLAAADIAWIDSRLKDGGVLKVAVRQGGNYAFTPLPDGRIEGFDYDLAVTLANSLGLRIEFSIQKDVAAFFAKDGVLPVDIDRRDYDFTPDLIKKVDLYANPFGVTPWRERLLKMATIYPIRNQLASRKGEEVTSIKGLDGKRFAVVKDSVQEKMLTEMATKNGIKLHFVYRTSEEQLLESVRNRTADYMLDGSVIFALNVDKAKDLGLMPFFTELQGVAWAVRKDDLAFGSILDKFLESSRRSGLLPMLWTKTFKMDFSAYINAMTASAESPPL